MTTRKWVGAFVAGALGMLLLFNSFPYRYFEERTISLSFLDDLISQHNALEDELRATLSAASGVKESIAFSAADKQSLIDLLNLNLQQMQDAKKTVVLFRKKLLKSDAGKTEYKIPHYISDACERDSKILKATSDTLKHIREIFLKWGDGNITV